MNSVYVIIKREQYHSEYFDDIEAIYSVKESAEKDCKLKNSQSLPVFGPVYRVEEYPVL